MIKSQLVQRIAALNPHLYQREVAKLVDAVLDQIVSALAKGDRVELRGFGAFTVKRRTARSGRNPKTGAPVTVEQKVVPAFKNRQGNAGALESNTRALTDGCMRSSSARRRMRLLIRRTSSKSRIQGRHLPRPQRLGSSNAAPARFESA